MIIITLCLRAPAPPDTFVRVCGFPRRMTCIFCKIAGGEIPGEMVVENEHAFAFLDIQPLRRGHVLVVPKGHVERFEQMSPEQAAAVAELSQEVVRRQVKALGAHGTTIAVNNGRAAGQEVHHVHVHVVPRTEGDGIGPVHGMFDGHVELQPGELKELGVKLRG